MERYAKNETPISELKVMMVDDNQFMLRQLSLMLKQCGVEQVQSFASSREAVVSLENQAAAVDIIFLDLNMPEIDGIEMLRHLSQLKVKSSLVLMSGQNTDIIDSARTLASLHQLNVAASLTKPITMLNLERTLVQASAPVHIREGYSGLVLNCDNIKEAMDEGWLVPFYQPKYVADREAISGVEVLARIDHPEHGILPPVAFIPAAEEHDLINEMTFCLLRKVLSQMNAWKRLGHDMAVSVNFCADSLCDVALPENLQLLMSEYQLHSSQLVLEVTETKLLQNLSCSLDVLIRLRMKGFGLSIDDFGTGYSNFKQLNQIPFSELKIDRLFVDGCANDEAKRAITESIVNLANKLNLKIVAEGVEFETDLIALKEMGVDQLQGFYFSRPLPASEMTSLLLSMD